MIWLKNKSHFILFCFLLITKAQLCFAQAINSKEAGFVDLSAFVHVYQGDEWSDASMEQLQNLSYQKVDSANIRMDRGGTYLFKIDVPNDVEVPFYLQISSADQQIFYVPNASGTYYELKAGYLVGAKERSLKSPKNIIKITEELAANQAIYAKMKPYLFSRISFDPKLYTQSNFDSLENSNLKTNHFYFLYNAFILGIFLIMTLYGIFSFWVTKDKTYLWYGLYLLFLGWYFALKFDNQLYHWNPEWQLSLFDPVPLISYYFYYRFVRSFLDLKKLLPKWDVILKYMGWLVVGYAICDLIFMQVAPNIEIRTIAYTLLRYLIILLSIVIIIRFYFTDSKLVHFINTGSMLLLIGATVTMIKNPLYYMQAGVALEILFFSLGLAYRNKLNEEAKREAQEQLLQEEQKELKLKTEFEKQLAKVEMNSLRAQMNPHFIFNSLNSIKHYIVKHNPVAASDYLAKFSKLMRLILQNSSSNRVSLASELEALKLYIQMEGMRFEGKFDFEVNVQKGIELEFIQIPAMLIQPYVENAIWHGLMHKKEKGLLTLDVRQNDQRLTFVVEDNGIGRKQAARVESTSAKLKKSLGMEITKDRIQLMNQLYGTNADVHIEDLVDENGIGIGTRVVLTIDGVKK